MTKHVHDAAAEADTLHAYLVDIARLPRLTPAEERDTARLVQQGDDAALNRLVEANLQFVVSYAKRYRGLGVPFLDLIHEGNLGLIEAAHRFDPARNVKFITYAVWWIRQSILNVLSDQGRIVSLPARLTGPAARLGAHVAALSTQLERAPTADELAEDLDISGADADALLQMQGDDVSLSERVGGPDGGSREIGDAIVQDAEPPVEDLLVREAMVHELRRAIVTELSDHEREVMLLRFGLSGKDPMTLQQVGEHLVPPITRERVRQLEERAKKKLRESGRLRGMRGLSPIAYRL